MTSGSAAKYPVLSLDEICALNVKEIADANSVLFMWVTTPFLPYGFEVMNAWGFDYKTSIFWIKEGTLGLGYWWRGNVEICLFGIRGRVEAFRTSNRNYIVAKPRKHSQKPEEFFKLVEPTLDKHNLSPRVELFAREERPGWVSWGNEILHR